MLLVEGESDRVALDTLARRLGRDLAADGVSIVPMGGATNIGHHVERFQQTVETIGGLCDETEEAAFLRALQSLGRTRVSSREDMQSLGFYVCVADLEDELIRALGADAVQRVVDQQGELASFRRFQRQPAHRPRMLEQQLHRFIGTKSGRKARYARALVEALRLDSLPPPLTGVLADV